MTCLLIATTLRKKSSARLFCISQSLHFTAVAHPLMTTSITVYLLVCGYSHNIRLLVYTVSPASDGTAWSPERQVQSKLGLDFGELIPRRPWQCWLALRQRTGIGKMSYHCVPVIWRYKKFWITSSVGGTSNLFSNYNRSLSGKGVSIAIFWVKYIVEQSDIVLTLQCVFLLVMTRATNF